jgi:hypothetical protein
MKIVEEGTGRNFEQSHNKDWPVHTRPMLEAYWRVTDQVNAATDDQVKTGHPRSVVMVASVG